MLILYADELLQADDYPSDQRCSSMLSRCLNVNLVNARLRYYALASEVPL